ncbi:uncharacterized protein LOC118407955 [Branchiostoma floridae]|uniref:Uncharacterized protein LOC118407955 n=1 Tax=Branchiostoma floridae TaxID=7739 RepID=A0A9J7HRG5_BRAFL|nr:uncharacterized protein LOC118407955 [Branchiostoma floridae]
MARWYASQPLLQIATDVVNFLNSNIIQDSFTGPVPEDVFTKKSRKHGYDCNKIAKELFDVFQLIGLESATLSYCEEKNHLSVSILYRGAELGIVHIDAGCHMQPFIIHNNEIERQINNGLGRTFHIKLNKDKEMISTTPLPYIEYCDNTEVTNPEKAKSTKSVLLPATKGNEIYKSLQNKQIDWNIGTGEANSLYFKSETGEVYQSIRLEIAQANYHYLNKQNQGKKKPKSKPQNLYFNIKVTATFYRPNGEHQKFILSGDGYNGVTYEEMKNKISALKLGVMVTEDEKEFIKKYRENEKLIDFLSVEDFFNCLLYYCQKYYEKWNTMNRPIEGNLKGVEHIKDSELPSARVAAESQTSGRFVG